MKRSEDNYLNFSKKEKKQDSTGCDPSFLENVEITPSPRSNKRVMRTHHILDFIKQNQGTTAWQISKQLEYSYSDVCRIIRDLEYVNAIVTRTEHLDTVVKKKLFIPKEDKNGSC